MTFERTLVLLVRDKPGVLNRIASLVRRRGFNINSISVGHSEIQGLSRMVITVNGVTTGVEQVRKQLDKLVDILKISDISEENLIARELALIKVESTPETRAELIQIAEIFKASIVDITPDSITIEVTGDEGKLNSLLGLLQGFGIIELTRTGRSAMAKGTPSPLSKKQ